MRHHAGLIQRAIERAGIGDEQTHVSGAKSRRQLNGDANVLSGLLPRAHGRFHHDGVAGMHDVAGVQSCAFEFDLGAAGNGIHLESMA